VNLFVGSKVRLAQLENGLLEIVLDRQGEAVNKLDQGTIDEFAHVIRLVQQAPEARGVLLTSAKSAFVVGADIFEFGEMFKLPVPQLAEHVGRTNSIFNAFEDLDVPTVAAINGLALGGGLELALAASHRIMSGTAQLGLPEVSLGLIPGFGGTVRLPRLAGMKLAADAITGGKPFDAPTALQTGVVDEVVESERLRAAALALLERTARDNDWRARQLRKQGPVSGSQADLETILSTVRSSATAFASRHLPAALAAIELLAKAAPLDRAGAVAAEGLAFARIAKTQAAGSLVQRFINEQQLKKLQKPYAASAERVRLAAVLGAGIMGGGIAFASAQKGVSILMKDIAQPQLDVGISEARKQVARLVRSGRRSEQAGQAIVDAIHPTLNYEGIAEADIVVEAVVENLQLKHRVLVELEALVRPGAVIASNTSSLRIDDIARPLARPELFVGMHFFNPVPAMPLVEIVRGVATGDDAVALAAGYALKMGKTPIIVKDCPGFLVNRILTAYVRGFLQLVNDGADFVAVDQAMEAFGWPMGPAYLEDVIGIDTGSHVNDTISAGYPDRMPNLQLDALRLLASRGMLGQKTGKGFYRYEPDAAGKPRKLPAPDTHDLLAQLQDGTREFSADDIVQRMMLPMLIEAAHALEEGIVQSPAELDMALTLGLGFPAYLGGPLKYADWLGMPAVVERAESFASLGEAYRPTARMREMAASGARYY
jgi:3-hydroxyacyl-CoA dehydrogenase / enoyl-CoA hydratase / 3-hydroxybutyryl-CoA epimerase / enoyl-CoA isomerase